MAVPDPDRRAVLGDVPLMGDIAVQFKIKNARLLRALRASEGFVSVVGFTRRHGLSYQNLIDYLAMRRTPISKDGEWNKSALDIAEALFADPGDLWPEEMRVVLSKSTGEFEVSIDDARMIAGRPNAIDRKALRLLASNLDPREAKILANFANDITLKDTADEMGIGRERVRQLQVRAIRKMQARAKHKNIRFTDVIDVEGT